METYVKSVNLSKKFGDYIAVNKVNLDVKKGEIYGFLGPNGAGKTTTIRMLTGSLNPSEGEVYICGLPLKEKEIEIKRMIGVIPDEPKLYEGLRGNEFLDFIIGIYQLNKDDIIPKIEELSSAFGIDYLNDYIGDYSHGMKQKLMLISVLMREPEVMFLDEPTVGIDARTEGALYCLLGKLNSEMGITIVMISHDIGAMTVHANKIACMTNKQIIINQNSKEFINSSLRDVYGYDVNLQVPRHFCENCCMKEGK